MTELEAWLRLWHTPKVGPKTFHFIYEQFPDLSCLYDFSILELVNRGVPKHIAHAITGNQSQDYLLDKKWLQYNESHSITLLKQPCYPKLLRSISIPPPVIYGCGNLSLLSSPLSLSIVGSRTATGLGKKVAFQVAKELAQLGIVIVSGLARGIDRQAHEGALSVSGDSTIAVLANGLDQTYPPEHRSLAKRISQDGLIISEFSLGVEPLARHFPRRNRIISGLSLGTLVIEAAQKSGSLITAKYAMEQGREVFAVPGPINNQSNQGCHQLIQQGAKLTTCVDDILMELEPMISYMRPSSTSDCTNNHQLLSADEAKILDLIDFTPTAIEKIIEKSGLTPERVSSMLTELELGGHVVTDAFGQYCRS